jgi:RNA polymerase sigma-70 factor (ECF subfamily)
MESELEPNARARAGKGAAGGWARRLWTNTRTSLIVRLRRGGQQVAMPALCTAYCGPVFAFICAIGCKPDDAHDVTQAFFESMFKPGFFDGYDPAKGQFRSWLRRAAKNFYFNWKRKYRRELVGVDQDAIEEYFDRESTDLSGPDRAFDRGLADALVRRARERLRSQYREEGQGELFSRLELAALGERPRTDDAVVARATGRSISWLKKERHDAKLEWLMRLNGCLREELATAGVRRGFIDGVLTELLDAVR